MRLPRNVVALGIVSFFTDVSSEMIYPLLPRFLSSVLGAGPLAIGAIEGAAESMASLLKLASGWWSDRNRRRKPLVVVGYALASAVRPLIGLAQSAAHVFALRMVDRVGKGIRTSPRDALIADSVDASRRGLAYGFHRAADHAGAVVGPLLAFLLLGWGRVSLRTVFLLAGIPAALAMVVLIFGVREAKAEGRRPPAEGSASASSFSARGPRPSALGRPFWLYLAVLFVFTLGNSADAFLLLRAGQLGVPAALIPLLWMMLHVVKSAASVSGGALSDRLGRRPLIVAGWCIYGLVYFGFARAGSPWQAWALFAAYGIYFGLTEGVEKALVADLVPQDVRGAAFGWYNLAIGIGALPASLLFGAIWERAGAGAAFTLGAGLALAAAAGLAVVVRAGPRTAPRRASA